MPNHQLLDNVTHKGLRVITERSAWYGDDVAATLVFPLEFRRLQAEYPIVFQKNAADGGYEPIALFGFDEAENLYLGPDGWEASYIPLSIERQPFLIGFANADDSDSPQGNPVVHVDMDSPRVSETDGVPVFLEHGGLSPYLEHINSVLQAIHSGYDRNRAFSAVLDALALVEPFTVEFELSDGEKKKLGGLHTIHEEKLASLDAQELAQLHRHGFLEDIYMVLASTSNLRRLIDRKNARLGG